MDNFISVLTEMDIVISPYYYGAGDLATSWEAKMIYDNYDFFSHIYENYPLIRIDNCDDYYLFLLSNKISAMNELVPLLSNDDEKKKLSLIIQNAKCAKDTIKPSHIVKFINENTEGIFGIEFKKHDMRRVTLEYIAKYWEGIDNKTFVFLCDKFGYLLIDRFSDFEKMFEKNPALFPLLFRSGKLEDINEFRYSKVLDIWSHICRKGKSNLKNCVEEMIPVLYEGLKNLVEITTIDNVMQNDAVVREFNNFLKKIKSQKANEFSKYAKKTEKILGQYITERGHSFKYEVPIGEIIEQWSTIENWILKLLFLTHHAKAENESFRFESSLSDANSITSITDLVSSNLPTDDFFTMSHQQSLRIDASVRSGTIHAILMREELRTEYMNMIVSASKIISEYLKGEDEGIQQEVELLMNMVDLVYANLNSDENIRQSLCYSEAMFSVSLSEKLLRTTYLHKVQDEQYVPVDNITLGSLLNCTNSEMAKLLGENHLKNLAFFLLQTGEKKIGYNYRNMLAHWSGISKNALTPALASTMLWIFTDVLNSVFYDVLVQTENIG